jgi:hypothetical protein
MQLAIVPYRPPATCTARAGHSRTFTDWVPRGGRVNPIMISASGGDPEAALPTTKATNETIQVVKAANRQAKVTQAAVVLALIFMIVIFSGLGVVIWRVNDNMAALQNFIQPHASQILNETLDILSDASGSLHNVHDVTTYTSQLAAVAGGSAGTASATLNHTAMITQQLENFLKHPTLQLSLGGGSSS